MVFLYVKLLCRQQGFHLPEKDVSFNFAGERPAGGNIVTGKGDVMLNTWKIAGGTGNVFHIHVGPGNQIIEISFCFSKTTDRSCTGSCF